VPGEKFTFHNRRSKGIMLKQKTYIGSRLRRRHLLGMFLVGITGAMGSACTTNFMGFFLTYYAKLTIKMPSKQASIFVIIEIPKTIRRTFY